MRQFESGATRDTEDGKLDYEGFLSPAVLLRFAKYMHKNKVQKDGAIREADNWQKGIPHSAYMKSMFRHFMDVWLQYRHTAGARTDIEESLCGLLFNVQGLLYEILKEKEGRNEQ